MTPTPSTPIESGDGNGTISSSGNSPDKKRKIDKTNRARWATRKLTVKSSSLKRLSLIGRQNRKSTVSEKKRQSGGSETLQASQDGQQQPDEENDAADDHGHGPGPRQLYFNTPLPKNMLDEDGNPIQQFTRNKIRTAKYTPLSFIPKNLWFQFQNIANIFFLFVVILVVSNAEPASRFPLRNPPGRLLTSSSSFPYSAALTRVSMPSP